VAKVGSKDTAVRRQLNGLSVAGQGTPGMLPKSPLPTPESLDGEQTRVKGSRLTATKTYVPVLSVDREVLMPTTPARASKWIKSGKATPFFRGQVFCVRMNVPTGKKVQPIAVGIDPGSKWEGYTVKSEAHTYLNIQADAVTWAKDAVEVRRNMRKARRQRKTPYRANRMNRSRGCLPPSTKARWQWKLRLAAWLKNIFPVSFFVVEDIKAESRKNCRKWNRSFSPLEVGKRWFYGELEKLGPVELRQGWETSEMRVAAGLKKSKSKSSEVFDAHCVDSWVLANWFVGGHIKPDNEKLLLLAPLQFHRRQLQVLQPAKGGVRKSYGGTRSLGFKRGSIVMHPKYGKTYVGGTSKGRISLHSLASGERLARNIKPKDCRFVTYNTWRTVLPLLAKAGSLRAER